MVRVPTRPSPHPMSWAVWARAARYFVVTAGALVLLNALLYLRDVAAERVLMEELGAQVARTQTRILSRELSGLRSDLLYLAGQPALINSLQAGKCTDELNAQHQRFGQNRRYDQVRVLDRKGREFSRVQQSQGAFKVVPEAQLQSKAARYYYLSAQSLGPGDLFLSRLDLNIEHRKIEQPWKPVIRGVVVVTSTQGQHLGMVVLNYLGRDLLNELAAGTTSPAGRAYMVDGRGYYLEGPTPEQSWGFMFSKPPTFRADHPEAWSKISEMVAGQFESPDGLFSIQRVRTPKPATYSMPRDDELSLRVVHFIPAATLTAGPRHTLRRTATISALAALPIFALLLYLAYGSVVRRTHEQRIEASEARLRTLSERLLSAQEDERRVIARNLHDDLGQHTTVIMLELQRALQARTLVRKEEIISGAVTATEQLLTRLHNVIASVRPTILDDLGLSAALIAYFEEYHARFNVTVSHDLDFDEDQLSRRLTDNVYRIVQEALVNTATHAETDKAFVQIRHEQDRLELLVVDRGCGFDPKEATERLGIVGMQERAELLGGHLRVRSAPQQGTEILVSIPTI